MDEQIAKLRRMTSKDAATWLIDKFPAGSSAYGTAFILMKHRSWKRSDQFRLAKYYFQNVPFSAAIPYEAFSSFMSIPNLIKVIHEYLPTKQEDKDLLMYYLEPALRKNAKSFSDEELINKLANELGRD